MTLQKPHICAFSCCTTAVRRHFLLCPDHWRWLADRDLKMLVCFLRKQGWDWGRALPRVLSSEVLAFLAGLEEKLPAPATNQENLVEVTHERLAASHPSKTGEKPCR